MTSVLFVHGIGTRRPQFDAAFEVIKRNLLSSRPGLTVIPCYWGEPLGAELYANGASIPDYPTTRGPEEMTEEDYQIALWEQLYRDPLFELRLLSIKEDDTAASQGRGGPPQPDLLRTFTPSTTLQTELEEAGIAEVFETARQSVQGSAAYRRALLAVPQAPDRYRAVTARALVARAIEVCEEQQTYAPLVTDARLRDRLIEQVGNELAGTRRAFGSWAAKQLFELALTLGIMDQVQRKRGSLTDATYPCAGDTILYQGRGEKIRTFITGLVQQAAPPPWCYSGTVWAESSVSTCWLSRRCRKCSFWSRLAHRLPSFTKLMRCTA